MTPLAQALLKNSLRPVVNRLPVRDEDGWLKDLSEYVCFDVSQIMPLCRWQTANMVQSKAPWPTLRLPAEKTWIEFQTAGAHRIAIMLRGSHRAGRTFIEVAIFGEATDEPGCGQVFSGGCIASLNYVQRPKLSMPSYFPPSDYDFAALIPLILAAINAPKVFARVEHRPHAGLAKQLAAAKGCVGRYPLHAWHEIKIEGWIPRVERGVRRGASATGEKAEHFVRGHPRFQNGRWVWVEWHKRGNPALGIKRGRYTVVMPKGPSPS